MIRATLMTLILVMCGCGSASRTSGSSSAGRAESAIVYATSDGTDAMHILGNRIWTGDPGELREAPLRDAPPTVTYSRHGDVACVSLDREGVSVFGTADTLRKGARFRCGTARFEVIDCDYPNDCRNAHILAFWRTGVAPNYGQLPVNYYYNRCRGIQSVTFSLDRPLRVGFGETLELRQGPGLLAQPDTPSCGQDPISGLFGDQAESSRNATAN